MNIHVVATDKAPKAVAAYSQAVIAQGIVYLSGQIGLEPATGELVPGGVRPQAERVLQNLAAVLAAAGSSFDKALKVTIYLTSIADFPVVNELYARYVAVGHPPARATVAVSALPRGALVEIDMIALVG